MASVPVPALPDVTVPGMIAERAGAVSVPATVPAPVSV